MADTYGSEDPTLPITPPPEQNNKQGKLVLGSFKDQARSSQRQPYQYSPSSQPPAEQPGVMYPQQRSAPPQHAPMGPRAQSARYPQQSPVPPGRQMPPPDAAPTIYPDRRQYPQQYPYPQQGPGAGIPGTPMGSRAARRQKGPRIGCMVTLLVVLLIGAFTFFTGQRVLAFGSAISNQSPLSTQTSYMGTSERVNMLVMGFGGGGHDGAYLTDSMLVVSVLPQSHHTSLISVPRDLWVQNPAGSGNYTKINAVYPVAAGSTNQNPVAGGNAAAQKVATVTGLDVKYWLTIDFTGFKQVIDSLGGIDVYVPDSFNACYPKNDDAAVDPSWIKVQFNKGMQHMDGATAISYARAREPLAVCGMGTSQNLAELTDFGRSARQQIIINAVLAQVKQISTWPRLYGTMDALQKSIRTNLSLADLSALALNMDLKDPKAAHIGLSNQNVLQDSQSNDGQYILQPQNGNWQGIADYIKQHLYN